MVLNDADHNIHGHSIVMSRSVEMHILPDDHLETGIVRSLRKLSMGYVTVAMKK